MSEATNVHIRWMIRRDVADVLAIETASFTVGTCWTEQDLISSLRDRDTIGMVCEVASEVVGFVVCKLLKKQIEVLNMAVHPAWRRRGVGRVIIDKLVSKLSSHRRRSILIPVRESNLDMQLFLKALYFNAVNVKRRYFEDTKEDAYLFVRGLAVEDESTSAVEEVGQP